MRAAKTKANGTAHVIISKLEALRGEKGWTQEELAARMRVSKSAYKKWLSGETAPPLKLLDAFAKVYKIPEKALHRAISDLIKEVT